MSRSPQRPRAVRSDLSALLRKRSAWLALVGVAILAVGAGVLVTARGPALRPSSPSVAPSVQSNGARPSATPAAVSADTPSPAPRLLELAAARVAFDLTLSVMVGSANVGTVEVTGAADSDANRWYTVLAPGEATPVGSVAWLDSVHVVRVSAWERSAVLQGEPVVDLQPYFIAASGNAGLGSDGLQCIPAEGAVDQALFAPLLGQTTVPAGTHYAYVVAPLGNAGCRVSFAAQYKTPKGASIAWTRELVLHPDPAAAPPPEAVAAAGFGSIASGQ
jgi:hypothetical protein